MEQQRICAFIDVLGFSNVMLGDDIERRNGLIMLLHRLAERTEPYGPNVQNLGLAISMAPSAEVTTFSDNVVMSFPLKAMYLPMVVGNIPQQMQVETNHFMNHVLIQIVSAVWDGLKLGVLFRGGISIGRLFHDGRVVAGEALVKAARLEKSTCYPRVEIESSVIAAVDDRGLPIIDDYTRETCISEADGRYFLRTLDFHAGYWRDHNWHRQQSNLPVQRVSEALEPIRQRIRTEESNVQASANEDVKEKWKWFSKEFESALSSGRWQQVLTGEAKG